MFLSLVAVGFAVGPMFDPDRLERDLPRVNDRLAREVGGLSKDLGGRLYGVGRHLVPAAQPTTGERSRAEVLAARRVLADGGDRYADQVRFARALDAAAAELRSGGPVTVRDLTGPRAPGLPERPDWPPRLRELARQNAELLDLRARLRDALADPNEK